MTEMNPLLAVGPLDGRYANKVDELRELTSEFGLIKHRLFVEAKWLEQLTSGLLPDRPRASKKDQADLMAIASGFSLKDANAVKEIEREVNHDVKAVEIWLRRKLSDHSFWSKHLELIHFGRTSEDINSAAYGLIISKAKEVLLAHVDQTAKALDAKAKKWAETPMLALTHGQPASPTTLGKEMRVFAERLKTAREAIDCIEAKAKFSGATGNYNADVIAYPDVEWPTVAAEFIEGLGLKYNPTTTQIEPHDWLAELYDAIARSNTILIDATQDIWGYISRKYLKQAVKKNEVGSSTMPHKVNPIDFENAEGNLSVANGAFRMMSQYLPTSRYQRDLSDSTVLRNAGVGIGHTLIAHQSLRRGLSKIKPDKTATRNDLRDEWLVLTEAVQTVMRRYDVPEAYEIIKKATRGGSLDKKDYLALVNSIAGLPKEAKRRLQKLTPETYTGLAREIAKNK